ncbi:uncharacterized protein J4E88_004536 [Alternaria novae-zelandiae]|uniref:uncharacterized protein n=1 Tax=Alternaria novae-zelandiae TaxID=430562 RepID=UPI0020C29751|nr:uncharacterized protein J4E88_004536 [Alternaria novae-zelandiae]KAI4683361.1 hypothetical protein J4E88_004536 [Alternaria novae-zelandiae]
MNHSIKSAAKTLANGLVTFYNESVSESGIPGIFPKPYYWWEAGLVFNALIDYSYLTGDSQYDSIVSEGIQAQLGEDYAFMPANQTGQITNEDQTTWALAALTAAETGFSPPENRSWAEYAAEVFDVQVLRWDEETCGGGLRYTIFTFQSGYDYKSNAATGDFFLLAARLAKLTGNETYSEWADKSYTWAKDRGLISDDYDVYDGTASLDNCEDANRVQWSYIHSVYTEGSAIMQNITNGEQKWTDAVQGFVNSSNIFFEDDILTEIACERNVIAAPSLAEPLTKKLEASAKAAAGICEEVSEDVKCSHSWDHADSLETASDGNLGEVFSALAVVQSLLFSKAKPLASNGTEAGDGDNATQSGDASGTSGAEVPKETGAAGTIAASVTAVLAVAFAAALSC